MRIAIDYSAAVNQRAGVGRLVRNQVLALAEFDQVNDYRLVYARPNRGSTPQFPPARNFASTGARQFLYAVWNGRRHMEWPALVDMLQLTAVTVRLFAGAPLNVAGFFAWNALTSVAALGVWSAFGGTDIHSQAVWMAALAAVT